MPEIIIPAREGRAVHLAKGERIRVTTPKGRQAADFFAFNAANIREWLSPPHSWVTTFSVKPRVGDVLISRFRRPMIKLVADGASGCHDMMIAACDQFRYEFFGHKGPHASCAENLQLAMRLHAAVLHASGEEDRGVRRARFMGVLHGHHRPAILIEGGFLSNRGEADNIESGAFRQKLAEAIANALR